MTVPHGKILVPYLSDGGEAPDTSAAAGERGKVTVAEDLTRAASIPLSPAEADYLRAATLTNIAAGLGDLGSSAPLIAAGRARLGGTPAGDAAGLAMQLHARTQDDFVPAGRAHIGAVTLAAAVALADQVGDGLLDCLAVGYRAMMMVARCYSADAQRRRYRPTGFFGPFGAAGVASRALGLDAAQTANALGLACVLTAGTNQAWLSGSDEWLLEVGMASRAGIECAELTEAGAQASAVAFEGAAGWATAFFADPGAARLAASLTEPLDITGSLATKPYPVSGIAQPMTHLAVLAHGQLAGRVPRHIEVRISRDESDYPGSLNRGPFSARGQALMSVAHCVACGITDGLVSLRRLDEPDELNPVLDIVDVVPDPDLPELDTTLTVQTDDGDIRLSLSGGSLLFAGWDDTDAGQVAHRSEAPVDAVEAARKELSQARPDSRVIREILARS
jgi:hypothetical protein